MTEQAVEVLMHGGQAWKADPTFRLSCDVVLPHQVTTRTSVAQIAVDKT